VDQVYIHLDFQPAAVCNAIGKRYFCQVAKIHAVLLIFVKTEILDQALCFFQLRTALSIQKFLYRSVQAHKFIKIKPGQFCVDQFPYTPILPLIHAHAVKKLTDGMLQKVYFYLYIVLFILRIGESDLQMLRVSQIYNAIVILAITEIFQQPHCLFKICTVSQRMRFFLLPACLLFRLRCFFRKFPAL